MTKKEILEEIESDKCWVPIIKSLDELNILIDQISKMRIDGCYLFARAAGSTPPFQFLSFYHVLEQFFVPYEPTKAQTRLKKVLGDPRFHPDSGTNIDKIIGACNAQQSYSERERLRLTIEALVTNDEILDFLDEDSERWAFLMGTKGKSVSNFVLPAKDKNADLAGALANRIYDIHCQVIHAETEQDEGGGKHLVPTRERIKHLGCDIEIIEWLARKALISSAILPNLKEA